MSVVRLSSRTLSFAPRLSHTTDRLWTLQDGLGRVAPAHRLKSDSPTRSLPLPDPPCSRKEVIQPHLPVRLPCYDFTPVMNLTVVSALPFRLGNRLLVKPTPMV